MCVCVCMCGHCAPAALGVEGEDALVVPPDQQQRRDVPGQRLQPAHVEGAGHGALPGQGHAPVDMSVTVCTALSQYIFFYI